MLTLMVAIIALLSIGLGVALLNALMGPTLSKAPPLQGVPPVSVLVPARDEERNIAACLEGLIAQDYTNFEVIVLNDHSLDKTEAVVRTYCELDARVKLVQGRGLADGWTGKNWACHQLSQHARGEIFVFTDADNRHAPQALARTVAWMQKWQVGLFSAFPQQITHTLAEKLVIPVVDMFVYAGLPLWLTYYARSPALAAANGQWLAFTRESYRQLNGHRGVRNQIVEDVAFSRAAKRKGIKILTAAGAGVVSCRMYHSFKEIWEGFSKNLFGLVAYRTIPFFAILLGLFAACVLPYFVVWLPPFSRVAAVAIGLNILLRTTLALAYRHPLLTSAALHPIGILLTLIIGVNSFWRVKRGRVSWKGRHIDSRRLHDRG